MNSVLVGVTAGACVFAGAMLGLVVSRLVPAAHRSKETQEVVRLGTGTVSILASILLGLLIVTAKTSSDTIDRDLRAFGADMIVLDRTLRAYGPEAEGARAAIRQVLAQSIQDLWPPGGMSYARISAGLEGSSAGVQLEAAARAVGALVPGNEMQRWLRGQALQSATGLIHQRWVLSEQSGPTIHPVVVVMLILWMSMMFACFGFNAPFNLTVMAAFLMCAVSIGSALFLVVEIDTPFSGLLRIPDAPMRRALAALSA